MSSSSSFIQILGCEGTAVYSVTNKSSNFHTSGRLQVMLSYDGMLMFKLNDFQYAFDGKHQIVIDRLDPQFQVVLSFGRKGQSKWIVKINQHADEVESCLDQKCVLVRKDKQKNQYSSQKEEKNSEVKEEKVQKQKQKQKIQKVKKVQKQRDSDELQVQKKNQINTKNVIIGASKGLGIGLAFTGKILAKGFQAIGTLTSKAVTPAAQKVQVSQNAKANIELAKKTSKTVLTFATTQIGNLFKFGKEAASNIGERFEQSDKGKQMQQNPKYQKVKQGTKIGVQALANVYDGVVTAVYEIGGGISKGTTQVIGKKYGEQAGNAADGVFEGVGNVVKITRAPIDGTYKTFKSEEE